MGTASDDSRAWHVMLDVRVRMPGVDNRTASHGISTAHRPDVSDDTSVVLARVAKLDLHVRHELPRTGNW